MNFTNLVILFFLISQISITPTISCNNIGKDSYCIAPEGFARKLLYTKSSQLYGTCLKKL